MYVPTIKIKYGWLKIISLPIVALFMLDYLGIKKEIKFLIIVLSIIVIIGFYKKIIVPRVEGWNVYLLSVICMIVYGFLKNSTRDFTKGSFYIISTLAMVVLGYYLARLEKKVSFEKTLYVIGILICIKDWFSILTNPSVLMDMQQLRDVMNIHIMDLVIILIVIFYECMICRKVIFGKRMDKFVVLFFAGTILGSLGRTQIIGTILGLATIYILSILKRDKKQHIIKNLISIVISGVVLIVLALNFLPKGTIQPFIDKIENSFTEISSKSDFSKREDINDNWRGYENKKAVEQWKRANVLEEIIGEGIGRNIEMTGLDTFTQQKYGMINSQSPILHSGYHTLLVKGGLLAIVGVLIWFLFPIYKVLVIKNNRRLVDIYIKMSAINITMMFSTYVVRGIATTAVFMGWALAIGWYSFEIRKMKYSREENNITKSNSIEKAKNREE